jgi:hypothetical protein
MCYESTGSMGMGCYILCNNKCVIVRIITVIHALKDFSYYDLRLNVIGF